MLSTALGIVRDGKIETLEGIILPEGQGYWSLCCLTMIFWSRKPARKT